MPTVSLRNSSKVMLFIWLPWAIRSQWNDASDCHKMKGVTYLPSLQTRQLHAGHTQLNKSHCYGKIIWYLTKINSYDMSGDNVACIYVQQWGLRCVVMLDGLFNNVSWQIQIEFQKYFSKYNFVCRNTIWCKAKSNTPPFPFSTK